MYWIKLVFKWKSQEFSLLTLRSVSSWLSATPDGKTAVTNPLGSGRRKCIGSGTSTVVPFVCWSMTFSMSCSWWIRPSNRAPKALQWEWERKVISSLTAVSVWLKEKVKVLPGWNLLLDGVIAGGRDNAVHGESCRQEVGFLGFFAEDWSWKRARLGHLRHQTDVNDSLNFETRAHRHQRIFTLNLSK